MRKRGRCQGGGGAARSVLAGARREERGEEVFKVLMQGPKYPRLKLDTKTPIGAKSEICT